MRYTTWADEVFSGWVKAAQGRYDFSLAEVSEAMGFGRLDYDSFARHEAVAEALMVAAYDLEAEGLVEFTNVAHGNKLTPFGRDVAEAGGLRTLWASIGAITLRADEEAFLGKLYEGSHGEEAQWATLAGVEAETTYRAIHPELGDYEASMAMMTLMGDLDRKGLIRRHLAGPTRQSYRPTYRGVVRISEADARDKGIDAGLVDWRSPTPGFAFVADRLAELKAKLASAQSDDDLSDIGRRCRDIAAEAVNVVFKSAMVPVGEEEPARRDAKRRLELYLKANLPGEDFDAYRGFLKASLALANARTHSNRTGYAAAVASAQGLLSFVRALEAIERSMRPAGEGDPT